jgi:hypothetical protein
LLYLNPMTASNLLKAPAAALFFTGLAVGQSVVDLDSLSPGTPCTEKIVLLREKSSGQYVWPETNGLNTMDIPSVARAVFAKFQDNFDFLFLNVQADGHDGSLMIRNANSGIGLALRESFGWDTIASRVKTVSEFSTFTDYKTHLKSPAWTTYRKFEANGFLHELEHTWCCFGKGFYSDTARELPGHYHSGVVSYNQTEEWIDPLYYDLWSRVGQDPKCITPNDKGILDRFSDFTLYLMGLLPPEQVNPILVRSWDSNWVDTLTKVRFSSLGPACFQAPTFTGERFLTIEEFVKINGPRLPTVANSQKEFNILPVIVVPYNVAPDMAFSDFTRDMLDTLEPAWAAATGGRSHVHLGCDLSPGPIVPRNAKRPGWHFRIEHGSLILSANPADPGPLRIDLVSLDGRLMRPLYAGHVPRSTLTIPLAKGKNEALPAGAYVVRIRSGKKEYARMISAMGW